LSYQRRTKFFNKRTEYNGRLYDSKGEAGLAQEIDLLIKSGKLLKVEPQKNFPLYGLHGAQICNHKVDFFVKLKNGTEQVWEYKGFATPIWRLKLKLFVDNYPFITYVVITAKGRRTYGRKS
jgi:hypothetical protein